MTRKWTAICAVVIICTVASWYGCLYGIRYYKKHAWARVPTMPATVSDSVKVVSLSCKGGSFLNNSVLMEFTANERTPITGEVLGDPQRWCNSLCAGMTRERRAVCFSESKLPMLYMRIRLWRSGGTKLDNEMNQASLSLKPRDTTAFVVSGQLHVPIRPGEYELQIWAMERDPAEPDEFYSREIRPMDVIVGRRTVNVRPR